MRFPFNKAFQALWLISPWGFCLLYCLLRIGRGGQLLSLFPFAVSLSLSLLLSLAILCWSRSRVIFALCSLVGTAPVLLQVQTLYMSGDLLSPLAIANADSAEAISVKFADVLPFIISLGSSFSLFFNRYAIVAFRPLLTTVVAVVWVGLAIQNASSSELGNPLRLPVLSLAIAVSDFVAADQEMAGAEERRALGDHFRRNVVYNDSPAYQAVFDSVPKQPNVIVLFVEGFSARLIGAYGGKHDGLTPNLDRFYGQSLVVDNYFNHTAATLRALRGQLTSSYIAARESGEHGLGSGSLAALAKGDHGAIVSLPQLLSKHGYQTAFLTPHFELMNINQIIRDTGINEVVTGSDVAKEIGTNVSPPLSDRTLFHYLPTAVAQLKPPFFIGVYNFGTHLFQDSPDEKFGDGNSVVLNRFHNLDAQFGKFYAEFAKSPLYDNTILIVTGDHAAYPAPEFLQIEDATPNYFVDRIPLMMFWKGVQHQVIDAGGRNSLSFAPTVLQLAKIKNETNYFLGCSIFGPACGHTNYITAVDQNYFSTRGGKVTFAKRIVGDSDFAAGRREIGQFLRYANF